MEFASIAALPELERGGTLFAFRRLALNANSKPGRWHCGAAILALSLPI